MRARSLIGLTALALTSLGMAAWRAEARFPHLKHQKLVTSCASCHADIASATRAERFPATAACENCHNGRDAKPVAWSIPVRHAGNLRFAHGTHAEKSAAKGETVRCAACHAVKGDTTFMNVGPARPSACISCHEHRSPAHLAATSACATCHVRLADATELADESIASFPKPDSHASPSFVSAHGDAARQDATKCATCHVRESCARCHPNADRLETVNSLGSAPRVAKLVADKAPRYPTPASHVDAKWVIEHGKASGAGLASCANCHAQPSCRACHTGTLGRDAIAQLPAPAPGNGPGVRLRGASERLIATDARREESGVLRLAARTDTTTRSQVRVHPPGFADNHQGAAASGRSTCTGCHEQRFCSSCHEGTSSRRFHNLNYLARHSSDAYGQDRNCSTCHNTESFCRSCHVKSGIGGKGAASTTAFHSGQPVWLLQHGQAAREGLSTCTSCHQQRDCLRCHSASTGWKVSPHSSSFDASRVSARNKQVCATCHATDPTKP